MSEVIEEKVHTVAEKRRKYKHVITRYRSKKAIAHQKWSVWTVGLEYSFMVLYTVFRELVRSWNLRFGDKLDHQRFRVLAAMRMYCCTTGFDKINIRNYRKFMIANRMMTNIYTKMHFGIKDIFRLKKDGYLEATDGLKYPKNVVLTMKARQLLKEFDVATRKIFDAPLVLPKELHGKKEKVVPVKKDHFKLIGWVDGVAKTRFRFDIESAIKLRDETIAMGIDSVIYKQVRIKGKRGRYTKKKKYVIYEDKKADRESVAGAAGVQ